jgi:hypothetical protein
MLGPESGTAVVTGTVVTFTSKSYPAGSGRLGDDPTFQRLTAAVPGRIEMALYADLGRALAGNQRFPVLKVGLVQSVDNGDHVGVVRVVLT